MKLTLEKTYSMFNFAFLGPRVIKTYQKNLKIYPSRRAAFRAAKRAAKIPVSQHPNDVVYPKTDKGIEYDLDDRNVRLFIFHILIGGISIEYHIREDKEATYKEEHGSQPPHFNAGEPPKKLKKHYYWKNANNK